MTASDERMQAARRTVNDPARLAAVRATGLLDQPAMESFDRMARLATDLLGVPAAFLSIVDEQHDFYLSQDGFDDPLRTARQLEGPTFCHLAITSHEPLVIDDTHADPVHRAIPTVETLGVGAYIGVPIVLPDGHVLGSFCAIDATPRRWSPREIAVMAELAASASREIALVLANRDKDRVLGTVAHDLRSPLTVLAGTAETLLAQARDRLQPQEIDLLERSVRIGHRMWGQVDELLEAATGIAGGMRLDLGDVDLAAVVQDTVAVLGDTADAKDITLVTRATGATGLRGDDRRLTRVATNLLHNAISYSPNGQGAAVEVVVDGGAADTVRLEIRDHGPGVAPDEAEQIFLPFERGSAQPTGGERSTGLGLSIVREVVVAHGGTVEVASPPGKGTTFTVVLPRGGPPQEPGPGSSKEST